MWKVIGLWNLEQKPLDVLSFVNCASCTQLLSCVWAPLGCAWILHNPMDCSPPGSPVHGIFQARFLEELCSLPVSCLTSDSPFLESIGSMAGLKVKSKRIYANTHPQDCCYQCPCPHSRPQLPHAATGDPQNSHAGLAQSLGGHCSFPLGPGACKDLFVSSKSLCFTQSCGSFIIKSHWPSKSDSPGIPSRFVKSLGWEVLCGA